MNYTASSSGVASVNIGRQVFHLNKSNPNYAVCLEALKENDEQKFLDNLNIVSALEKSSNGKVKVVGGEVTYCGEVVHNVVSKRIIDQLSEGFKVDNLMAFLERLMQNPSKRSIEELYSFIEAKNLPITADGHFLGYKSVQYAKGRYLDWHTGTIENKPGDVVEKKRNEVDDDARVECSNGLHVGNLRYASDFNSESSDYRLLIVKVDPADAVCVPYADAQKIRVCRYTVVGEFEGPLPDLISDEDRKALDTGKQAIRDDDYYKEWKDSRASLQDRGFDVDEIEDDLDSSDWDDEDDLDDYDDEEDDVDEIEDDLLENASIREMIEYAIDEKNGRFTRAESLIRQTALWDAYCDEFPDAR